MRKDIKTRRFHKKKGGNAYIVDDWVTYIDSASGSSSCNSDKEQDKMVVLAMGFSYPPSPPSSSTHLCLVANIDRKLHSGQKFMLLYMMD
jgi:hypothetical protein